MFCWRYLIQREDLVALNFNAFDRQDGISPIWQSGTCHDPNGLLGAHEHSWYLPRQNFSNNLERKLVVRGRSQRILRADRKAIHHGSRELWNITVTANV